MFFLFVVLCPAYSLLGHFLPFLYCIPLISRSTRTSMFLLPCTVLYVFIFKFLWFRENRRSFWCGNLWTLINNLFFSSLKIETRLKIFESSRNFLIFGSYYCWSMYIVSEICIQYWGFYRNSPTRFSTSIFFHHSNQPGPLINKFEYLRF